MFGTRAVSIRQDNYVAKRTPTVTLVKNSVKAIFAITYIIRSFTRLGGGLSTVFSGARILRFYPNLLNKEIYSAYLAKRFDNNISLRYEIFISHYVFMAERVAAAFYQKIASKLLLWQSNIDNELCEIYITLERRWRREGDFTLVFEINRVEIYHLSFTVIRGDLIGGSPSPILFVARVQGVKERFTEIDRATKCCKDIVPPYLLVVAAQAIASELDISLVAGVSGREQLSQNETGGFPFDYDAFWKACSGIANDRDFYVFSTWFAGKPISQINPVHRRRTLLKRKFKGKIGECVRITFARKCLRVCPETLLDPGDPSNHEALRNL